MSTFKTSFEITVSLYNGDVMNFNFNESKFVNDASDSTRVDTLEIARQYIDVARAAWNEFDKIRLWEVTAELDEDGDYIDADSKIVEEIQ